MSSNPINTQPTPTPQVASPAPATPVVQPASEISGAQPPLVSQEQSVNPVETVDLKNPFSSPQTDQQSEYALKFPDTLPSEVAALHTNAFKEVGIEEDKAQKVIDALLKGEDQAYFQQTEALKLKASLLADKEALRKELGAEYEFRERSISRYFKDTNIPDTDVQTLVSQCKRHSNFLIVMPK